jgi:hypothetical protein
MNYQQVLNPNTNEVDPNLITLVGDNGERTMMIAAPGSTLWDAYLMWLAQGNTPLSPRVETLDLIKTELMSYIDTSVANVYSTWMRFQAEYEAREAAAQAFKAAGYEGDAGIWVTGFATAAGLTPQAAADKILVQSVSLRGALSSLGALRMRKYEIMACTDAVSARAKYDEIVANVATLATSIQ